MKVLTGFQSEVDAIFRKALDIGFFVEAPDDHPRHVADWMYMGENDAGFTGFKHRVDRRYVWVDLRPQRAPTENIVAFPGGQIRTVEPDVLESYRQALRAGVLVRVPPDDPMHITNWIYSGQNDTGQTVFIERTSACRICFNASGVKS